jgi:hypothetical protein
MKKIISFIVFFFSCLFLFAQEEELSKREKTFIGSGINLGFFNGFIIGLNPEIGYSANRFVDMGVATNFSYITQRFINSPQTDRLLIVGGGPYIRFWPVQMIFLGSQFEYNYISFSSKSGSEVFNRGNTSAPSVLLGGGYGNRFIGGSQFYTSVMVDVLGNPKSPYVDQFNRKQLVFRTAFLFYLRPKNQKGR